MKALLVFTCVLSPLLVGQNDNDNDLGTLKGKPTIFLGVSVNRELSAYGLSQNSLQTDVELALRRNKIPYITHASDSILDTVLLQISVDGTRSKAIGEISYLVQVQVHDRLLSLRTNTPVIVITWQSHSSGLVASERLDLLRGEVSDHVNKFCLAYLKANDSERK